MRPSSIELSRNLWFRAEIQLELEREESQYGVALLRINFTLVLVSQEEES